MTQEYKIWKPEHDGHAPPNWREGMKVFDFRPTASHEWRELLLGPSWGEDYEYRVPAEALNSPNDDAPEVENGLPPLAKLVGWLGDYTTEELAKHGITLAPEKDWATELWAELFTIRGMTGFAKSIREGRIDDDDRAAIELLRTRFEQMIAERNRND